MWWMYQLRYTCGECINWGTHVANVSIEVHMWWMYQLRYTCGECINLCKKYMVNVSLGVQMWWMYQSGYKYLVKVSFEVKNSCCESINCGKTKLLLVIWIFPFGWDWMWPWLTNSLNSTSFSFIHTTFEHTYYYRFVTGRNWLYKFGQSNWNVVKVIYQILLFRSNISYKISFEFRFRSWTLSNLWDNEFQEAFGLLFILVLMAFCCLIKWKSMALC